jgi:hypothetical protein
MVGYRTASRVDMLNKPMMPIDGFGAVVLAVRSSDPTKLVRPWIKPRRSTSRILPRRETEA